MNIKIIVEKLIDPFLKAGDLSISLREKGLKKEIKSDNTPVSNGDLEVNKFITKKISEITPDIPIVSEETSDNKDNTKLKDFWLVDPIDGTYDYINNLEEFTINAGLIINNKPAAGLIYAPAKKRMFYSYGEGDAYELSDGKTTKLNEKDTVTRPIKFISYSNKIKPEIQKIYQDIGVVENVRMKSSLKFCVVAASEYDGYVAEPRAYEWDIAAGHAILIHSGGTVTDFNGDEILYGKKDLKNPSLILKSKNILLYSGYSPFKWNYTFSINNALGGSETAITCLTKNFPKDYTIYVAGEVEEETGIQNIQLHEMLNFTNHTYFDKYLNQEVVKRTYWFHMTIPTAQSGIPQISEDIEKIEWHSLATAKHCLEQTYPNIIEVIEAYRLKINEI